jgi:hypothetical protein
MTRTTAFALLLGTCAALSASVVQAREAPERELQMLGRCAIATGVYRSILTTQGVPVTPTEADQALYARLKAVEPLLKARADGLAAQVDEATREGLKKDLTAQYMAQMNPKDGPRRSPREALDLYAPILEACVVRAGMLPRS